jgi:hypothetical protein
MNFTAITAIISALTTLGPVVQTIVNDFIGMARVTSPLLNPTAPASITAAHPYSTVTLLQHLYNTYAQPATPLVEDGVWGPLSDRAIAALLASYQFTAATAPAAAPAAVAVKPAA